MELDKLYWLRLTRGEISLLVYLLGEFLANLRFGGAEKTAGYEEASQLYERLTDTLKEE